MRCLPDDATATELGTWQGRWTPNALRALHGATDQARMLGHTTVAGEHVLLGLLLTPSRPATDALGHLGITLEHILACALPGPCDPQAYECMVVTPQLKQALQLAAAIAERSGNRDADCGHLLAAITETTDALSKELLDALGISTAQLRDAVRVESRGRR